MHNHASSPSAVLPYQFENHEVRVLTVNGDPWFVARDVCVVLGLDHVTNALAGLDDDEKGCRKVTTPGGPQEMIIISESGLYTLIIRSNKPQARPFRRWVTAEVLPSIRRTGGYTLVPARKEKLVTVDHRYTRNNPANPHNIRYHLDLTRVVTKPTRQSLEILTRLTGVDFSDIDLAEGEGERAAWVNAFLAACCQVGPEEREGSTRLYQAFVLWRRQTGFQLQDLPSQRAFSLCLKERPDVTSRRAADGVYWLGLRLLPEWAEQVEREEVAA